MKENKPQHSFNKIDDVAVTSTLSEQSGGVSLFVDGPITKLSNPDRVVSIPKYLISYSFDNGCHRQLLRLYKMKFAFEGGCFKNYSRRMDYMSTVTGVCERSMRSCIAFWVSRGILKKEGGHLFFCSHERMMFICGYKAKGYIDSRNGGLLRREYSMHKVALKDLCEEEFIKSAYIENYNQQVYKIINKKRKEINAYIEGVKDGSIVHAGKKVAISSEGAEIYLILSEHDARIALSAKWKKEHSYDAPVNNPYDVIMSRRVISKMVGRRSARTGTSVVRKMTGKGILSDSGRCFRFHRNVKLDVAKYLCEYMYKVSSKNVFEDSRGCFLRLPNQVSLISNKSIMKGL